MKNPFDIESPVYKGLSFVADMMLLNIMWVICSLPIITIGPATSAMYQCFFKLRRHGDFSVFRDFISAFKENFKQALVLMLIVLLVFAAVAGEIYMLWLFGFYNSPIGKIVMFLLAYWVLATVSYLFPLLGCFANKNFQTIKNAWIFAMTNLFQSIVITLLNLLPVFTLLIFSAEVFVKCMLIYGIIGFSATAYVNSGILLKIFLRYASREQE